MNNGNGCLMQLAVLISLLFGGLMLAGPTIGNIVELDPPTGDFVTVAPTRIPPSLVPSPTLIEATFTPSPTIIASDTATFTPTAIPTATNTPTETDLPTETNEPTDTPEPTNTATATSTNTPTFTPTPTNLCELRVNRVLAVNVREESNASSPLVIQMPNNTSMEAFDQEIGFDNFIWYFIQVTVDDELYTGWVRSDLVEQVTPCPPLE